MSTAQWRSLRTCSRRCGAYIRHADRVVRGHVPDIPTTADEHGTRQHVAMVLGLTVAQVRRAELSGLRKLRDSELLAQLWREMAA